MGSESLLRDKKIVVTGGCGFIGSHLVAALWRDNQVIVVDNLASGSKSNIEGFDVDYVCYDVVDKLDDLFAGVDIVFHTAANVQVSASVIDPEQDARTNILGGISVLNAVRRTGVTRLVYSSSAAVYGVPERLPVGEEHPTKPISPYGLSKLTAERYFLIYRQLENLPVVCLRYFNVFGPRQSARSPYSGVIAIFARNLIESLPSVIYGDGEQTRDFIHVNDVVRANLLAASLPEEQVVGRVFNIGTGHATSLNQLVDLLQIPVSSVSYAAERPGDIRESVAAVGRARDMMGFSAQVPLEQGLQDYVSWLKQFESGC